MQESEPSARHSRVSLGVVYFTVFFDILGFGLILPSLPQYARDLGASGFLLGVLLSSYSMAQLFGALLFGRLSDRLGRRPVLLLSLGGSTVGMVLSGLAPGFVWLCLARAFSGFFGGSISAAQAYIADVTAPEERARYMGMLGAAIGSGFVAGPALGVAMLASGRGFRESAFVAAGLALANLVVGFFRLIESRRMDEPKSRDQSQAWLDALRRPMPRAALGAMFLSTFAFVGMETTFAFYGADKFGLSEVGFGMTLVYVGIILILVQGGAIGALTRRFSVQKVAALGGLAMALTLAGLPFVPTLPWTLVMLGMLAASQGLTLPTLPTLLSQASDTADQGAVLGLGRSLGSCARALGPLVAGTLYDLHMASPYLMGALLALVAGLLVLTVRH